MCAIEQSLHAVWVVNCPTFAAIFSCFTTAARRVSVSERVPPTTTGVTDGEPTELTTDSVTTASTSPAVDSPAGVKGKLRWPECGSYWLVSPLREHTCHMGLQCYLPPGRGGIIDVSQSLTDTPARIVCSSNVVTVRCPSVCPSVCPFYRPLQQRAAGLLLWARRASDIDRLLQQATAHSSTAASSKCEDCVTVRSVVNIARLTIRSIYCSRGGGEGRADPLIVAPFIGAA